GRPGSSPGRSRRSRWADRSGRRPSQPDPEWRSGPGSRPDRQSSARSGSRRRVGSGSVEAPRATRRASPRCWIARVTCTPAPKPSCSSFVCSRTPATGRSERARARGSRHSTFTTGVPQMTPLDTALVYRSPKLGDFSYGTEDVIRFPQGIAGFEQLREFVLLARDECDPFIFLAALEQPEVALPLVPVAPGTLDVRPSRVAFASLGQRPQARRTARRQRAQQRRDPSRRNLPEDPGRQPDGGGRPARADRRLGPGGTCASPAHARASGHGWYSMREAVRTLMPWTRL